MVKKSLVLLVFFVALSAMAGAKPARKSSGGRPKTPAALIKQLGESGSVVTRTRLARDLAESVAANPQAIGGDELRSMIPFLGDSLGSVRAWVATAIGNLGARGKDAVPALEVALKKQEAIDQQRPVSLSPAAAMEAALRKIRLACKSDVDAGPASAQE